MKKTLEESLNKIYAVCGANAFRSPFIESSIRDSLNKYSEKYNINLENIAVQGRGVKASYWKRVVAGEEDIPEKYVQPAIDRFKKNKDNYSENIENMVKNSKDYKETARHILGEERHSYIEMIKRYADENGMPYPKGFHQQLKKSDINPNNHYIVASEKEAVSLMSYIKDNYNEEMAEKLKNKITILGIEDSLGGDYKNKKESMDKMKDKVYNVLGEILKQYNILPKGEVYHQNQYGIA